MDWLSIAKALPTGHKTRSDCPQCGAGTNTNAAIVNHQIKGYSLFCNACGYNPFVDKGVMTLAELKELKELNDAASRYTDWDCRLPNDFSEVAIPVEGRLWLYSSGLTETIIRRYGIGYSAKLRRVVIPVRDARQNLVWYQARAVHTGQKPKYIQPSRDKGGTLFSTTIDAANSESTVIITEDILSCIKLESAGYIAASILGTKISTGQINRLAKFKRANVWLDGDAAGVKASTAVRRSLSLVTYATSIRTRKDPKKYSRDELRRIIEGTADTDGEGYVP
jgi:hypothetical protein